MPEAALLVLSRALSAPRVACFDAAAKAGVTALRVRQVAALLLVHERGPQRTLELGVELGTMAGQPLVDAFRRLGLMTVTGGGRNRRVSLTDSGQVLSEAFATTLDRQWKRATSVLPESHVTEVLTVLESVSDGPTSSPRSSGFPVGLIVALDNLVAKSVHSTLTFTANPILRDAALRPLLLLAGGPSTPTALAIELGIRAPAVNVALATSHRTGLVERRQQNLRLTELGERVAGRIRLGSDIFWLDVERAGGTELRSDTQILISNLGRGFPANARP